MIICSVRIIPRRNPIFHMNEIDEGVGRSISDFFIVNVIGFFFISWFFIKRMLILFGLGGGHVLRLLLW